jgi:hypothetical protein
MTMSDEGKAKHVPRPWSVSLIRGAYVIYDAESVPIFRIHHDLLPFAKDTAEFICRACNAHDDLLAALKLLRRVAPRYFFCGPAGPENDWQRAITQADAAIAKASPPDGEEVGRE